MIYANCYYSLNDEIIYVSYYMTKQDELLLQAFRCKRIDNPASDDPEVEEYLPFGDPIPMHPDDLSIAKNLCTNCLSCRYLQIFNPVDYAYVGQKIKTLDCSLHGKHIFDHISEIMPNCEYLCPIKLFPDSVEEPPIIDLKKCIGEIVTRHEATVLVSEYYSMPPNVFMVLKTFLNADDLVYFGTGDSKCNDCSYGVRGHANLKDYLSYSGEDTSILCYRVGDISEGLYTKLTSDWFGDYPLHYVICIPAIDFACYGDEEITGYHYGYLFFARQEIAEALKKEHEATDWSKYVPDLQKD